MSSLNPSATIRLSGTPPRVACVPESFTAGPVLVRRTLEQHLRTSGPFSVHRSVHIATRLLEALDPGRNRQALPQDIHPDGILLGAGDQVDLVAMPPSLPGPVTAFPYLAPEILRGSPADTRSDTYSAGVILFQMLTGSLPFRAPNAYLMLRKQLEEPPPALQSFGVTVPEGLEAVLRRALEKDPTRRYASTCQFREALDPFLPVSLMQTRVTKAYTPTPPPSLRHDLTHWIALAAIFLVSALYLAFSASERPQKPMDDPLARHPLPLVFEKQARHR
jgi:serine/threonine protein kinase